MASAGDQVTVDGQGRVSSWESLGDSGISAEQPEQEAQPVLVEDAYGGQPVIRFDAWTIPCRLIWILTERVP
ncbi:MAG: hypothetical protein ACLR30_11095 [[Clostridium] leptum]